MQDACLGRGGQAVVTGFYEDAWQANFLFTSQATNSALFRNISQHRRVIYGKLIMTNYLAAKLASPIAILSKLKPNVCVPDPLPNLNLYENRERDGHKVVPSQFLYL